MSLMIDLLYIEGLEGPRGCNCWCPVVHVNYSVLDWISESSLWSSLYKLSSFCLKLKCWTILYAVVDWEDDFMYKVVALWDRLVDDRPHI